MSEQYTIGIDLGGTNIKGGICDSQHNLIHKQSIDTEAERGFEHVLGRMVKLVDQMLDAQGLTRDDIRGAGIGAPGPMSHTKGIVYGAPNLPGFVNVPLAQRFAEASGLSVSLENDANAAAYGEFTAGAGSDVQNMVMLTLGTGVGGGVVIDGKLLRGGLDNAGEIGHTIVVPNGRACPCGQRGCLERYASANAVAERLREAVRGGEHSSLEQRALSGAAFDARDVLEAVGAGDVLARRIWDETCFYLALCIVNVQHFLNPELVVFAGGLINAGARLLEPIEMQFEQLSWRIAPDRPRIALATLGTDAGTIGAAALAPGERLGRRDRGGERSRD